MEGMFFLSGLPRTGSTLLSAILSQNPDLLSEGTSGLLELIWQNQRLFEENQFIIESLKNNNKTDVQNDVIQGLPNLYYRDNDQKYIVDKNRNWSNNTNIEMIKRYVTTSPKIIVMLRPIEEIAESFYYIHKKNKRLDQLEQHLFYQDNPLMFPFNNLLDALLKNKDCLLLLTYKELVEQPKNVIDKIYNFLQIPKYKHNFDNIINITPEGDYGLNGLHEVRNQIGYRDKKIKLPRHIKQQALKMQKQLEQTLEAVGEYDIFKK